MATTTKKSVFKDTVGKGYQKTKDYGRKYKSDVREAYDIGSQEAGMMLTTFPNALARELLRHTGTGKVSSTAARRISTQSNTPEKARKIGSVSNVGVGIKRKS